MRTTPRRVFVTGGTGYIGRPLIQRLLLGGHDVRALVRESSLGKLPPGCTPVPGDALDAASFVASVAPADTLVHLVGTPHPGPGKAAQFRRVDLGSVHAAVDAAVEAGVRHFVYVSVAQPAPVMREFVAARMEGERLVRHSGLDATIVRPWYVLGPGHRWPYALAPLYALAGMMPSSRDTARRLGLVTLAQMVDTLVDAVEHPASGVRIVDVDAIKRPRMAAGYEQKQTAAAD